MYGRGLGFELPIGDIAGSGGGGFFSSIFDVLGSAAQAAPQFLPAITNTLSQSQQKNQGKPPRFGSQQSGQPFVLPPLDASPASAPFPWLLVALAFMTGAAISPALTSPAHSPLRTGQTDAANDSEFLSFSLHALTVTTIQKKDIGVQMAMVRRLTRESIIKDSRGILRHDFPLDLFGYRVVG